MTKLKLFLVLAIICYITANVRAQYPRDSAINLVVKQLLVSDMGHINLYASLNIKSGSNGLSLLSDEPKLNHSSYATTFFFAFVDRSFLLSFFAFSSFINFLKSRSSSSVQGLDCTVKSTSFGSLISPILL